MTVPSSVPSSVVTNAIVFFDEAKFAPIKLLSRATGRAAFSRRASYSPINVRYSLSFMRTVRLIPSDPTLNPFPISEYADRNALTFPFATLLDFAS